MSIRQFSGIGVMVVAVAAAGGLLAGIAHAETRVGGKITGVESWEKAGNPHIVTADITVAKGARLEIGPGVELRFKADINDREGANAFDLELLVEGELVVNGAEGDTVVLTSASPAPRWTDWQGVVVRGAEARAEFKVTRIQYANEGVKVFGGEVVADHLTVRRCNQFGLFFIGGRGQLTDLLVTEIANPGGTAYGANLDQSSDVTIRDSFVMNAQNGVVFSRGSTGALDKVVVTLCAGPGVLVHNSTPTITRCTLTGNQYGLMASAGSRPEVHYNNIFGNGTAGVWLKGYGKERVELDFSNNWWGVTELGLVEDQVHDGVDDPLENGFAIIDPFLSEPTTDEAEKRSDQ